MIEVSTHRLSNGITLLHHYDGATRMVALHLFYNVGSRDEQPGHTGLAHLLEHLMFTGSRHVLRYDAPIQAAGGESNAWTSSDMTCYYDVVPAHNIATALWTESDRLLDLTLSDESIIAQKSVVAEEFKERCLNAPYGDVYHLMSSLAYKVHPYRWHTIGNSVEEIESLSRDEVRSFHKRFYVPGNLVMCISGNIDCDRAVGLAEQWFGGIPACEKPLRSLPQEPVQTSPRVLEVQRDVPQNLIMRAYHMCGRGDADYHACDMLSDVLANGKSSRFYVNVLTRSGLFSELDAAVGGSHDPGLFYIRGRLADGVSWQQAEDAIDNELRQLVEQGVSEYEVEKCANKAESTMLFENVGYAAKATKLCMFHLLTGDASDINREVSRYRRLTPDDLNRVSRRLFSPDNCNTLRYGARR